MLLALGQGSGYATSGSAFLLLGLGAAFVLLAGIGVLVFVLRRR